MKTMVCSAMVDCFRRGALEGIDLEAIEALRGNEKVLIELRETMERDAENMFWL